MMVIVSLADKAAAIDCSPFWTLETPHWLRNADVSRRLGADLWAKLLRRADEDQWKMILAQSQILIEATPARLVHVKNHDPKQPARSVIEYRNVTWLRDLRRGAPRPGTVALGITYFGEEGSNTQIEEDKEFPDPSQLLPQADPQRRYIIGVPLTENEKLKVFANSLTDLPIADVGDPTSGCTNLFTMETAPPVGDSTNESSPWGSRLHWETGMKMIDQFRDRPELH